jgi:pimeloyl-ACP methyl ester carboxylesterase
MSSNNKYTYVFIHGAWHGAWCWKYIESNLINLRQKVICLDLPGHGKNVVTPFSKIDLCQYVKYVSDIILELKDKVILVGHSMAGVVISQIAENIPDKILRLVYIAAFIPENNSMLVAEEGMSMKPSVSKETLIKKEDNMISIKNSKKIKELFYNNCTEEDFIYALNRLQDQPLQPFFDKIAISNERFGGVPKVYIECTEDGAINIEDQRRMHSRIMCEVVSLTSDHSPFFSNVSELVNILVYIAKF